MAVRGSRGADPRFIFFRWAIFTTLATGFMLVFFHRIAPGVVASDLSAAFGVSGAALGSLAAAYYYIYTAMQIPAGVLADTVGTRLSVTVGNAVAGAGAIAFALAETFLTASLGRFLVGLGVSVVFVGLMKSNTVWFSDRRYGFVSGLTLFIGNLGAVAATGPLALVLDHADWREVFLALGGLSLVLSALSWLLVRNRPQELGYASVAEMEGGPPPVARSQHWVRDLVSLVRMPRLVPPGVVMFGVAGGFLAFVGLWAIPLLQDLHGLDRTGAADYTTVALLGFAGATLAAGTLSDHWGRRKPVLIAASMGYLATLTVIGFAPWQAGPAGLGLFALLGVTAGGFVVAYAQAKEVAPPQLSGMAIALVNTALFLGAAIAQPAFGWAMDLWAALEGYGIASYRAGFTVLLTMALSAVVAACVLFETRCRNIHQRP